MAAPPPKRNGLTELKRYLSTIKDAFWGSVKTYIQTSDEYNNLRRLIYQNEDAQTAIQELEDMLCTLPENTVCDTEITRIRFIYIQFFETIAEQFGFGCDEFCISLFSDFDNQNQTILECELVQLFKELCSRLRKLPDSVIEQTITHYFDDELPNKVCPPLLRLQAVITKNILSRIAPDSSS